MLIRGLACLFAASIAWAEVADATAEPAGTHRFRIAFNLEPADAPLSIFASHLPHRLEDTKPLVVTSSSPHDVHVHGWKGRPYFHLKTATGETRVVSIRRLPLEGQNNFRDLGGYRTADRKYVRWGLLYRSGQPADAL